MLGSLTLLMLLTFGLEGLNWEMSGGPPSSMMTVFVLRPWGRSQQKVGHLSFVPK